MSKPKIRPASKEEMAQIVDLAANEGWNPGLNDAGIFYAADPNGFFVMEADGAIIGSISAVAYDDLFGFIGLYIVKRHYRGKGLGIQLWHHAMDYLGKRNIGLDGVVEQQENYKKSRFRFAYNNIRFQYINAAPYPSGNETVPLGDIPFDKIAAFDRQHFPAERDAFLKRWILQPDSIGLAVKQESVLTGYILMRKCREGYKAGPLFARTPEIARTLWDEALAMLPEDSVVYLDIPEPHRNAMQLAKEYNMTKVFETARMYTGDFPEIDLNMIYGVTSFELG